MQIEHKYKWKYNSNSTRLQNWDYSWDWYYFITICTKDRENYFWEIIDWKMKLWDFWKIIEKFYLEIPNHFDNVKLDEYVIMPNHIHWIIIIDNKMNNKNNVNNVNGVNGVETRHCLVSTGKIWNKENIWKNRFQNQWKKTLSSIIWSFKSICTKTINKIQNKTFFAWQPRFYEHIIRDDESLNNIRKYIIENPLNWENDENFKK